MIIELIQGPFWNIAVTVFAVGVIWRIVSILYIGLKRDLSAPRRLGFGGALTTIFRRSIPRREAARASRFQLIAGYMFHLGLVALLFFGAPHVAFIEERILGFGWRAMPYWAFVISAQLAFIGLLLLWLRRLMHPVTRLLSSVDDHLAAVLTFVAMFTGCLALFESYTGLQALHLLTVEILMVYFPFSNLMHAFTFILSRGYTGAAYGRHGVNV